MFTKNLHLCFSKIKCLPTSLSPPLTLDDQEEEEEEEEDPQEYHHHDSVYDVFLSASSAATTTTTDDGDSNFSATSSSDPPDFSNAFASHRFFVSSPGNSNSILDSSSSSPRRHPDQLVGGGVPIRKYSPDPFSDFRKSMQEMIEAREKQDKTSTINDWEYLHELLLSYLSLNPRHTHKFIIGAFADLLVSLMYSSSDD